MMHFSSAPPTLGLPGAPSALTTPPMLRNMFSYLKPDQLAVALTRFADGASGSARPPLPIHTTVESARAIAALRATAAPPLPAPAPSASPFRRGFTPAAATPRAPAWAFGADLDVELPPADDGAAAPAAVGAVAPAAALSVKDLAAAHTLAGVQRRDEAIFAAFGDALSQTNAQFRDSAGAYPLYCARAKRQ